MEALGGNCDSDSGEGLRLMTCASRQDDETYKYTREPALGKWKCPASRKQPVPGDVGAEVRRTTGA